nr:MAG TPA_asm: hypothetical protein [Caudoviricetes sp.]
MINLIRKKVLLCYSYQPVVEIVTACFTAASLMVK